MSRDNPKFYTEEQFNEYRRRAIQTLQQRMDASQTLNEIPGDSGPFHTAVPEPILNFVGAPDQYQIQKNNAYIVLSHDRPSDLTSGYGRAGAQRASSIDMVVGRMAAFNNGLGPGDGATVHNHYGLDAARIVLSQTTDIDTNFGIADGKLGSVQGRSGIGIKADSVRVIGREGIKIVTGKAPFPQFGPTGETNSRGMQILPAPKIELIAGNNTEPIEVLGNEYHPTARVDILQPVVLGTNTLDAISGLSSIVDEVWSALFNLSLIQNAMNAILAVDVIMPQGGAKAQATTVAATQIIDMVMNSLWQTRVNKLMWEVNFLEKFGYKFICSSNVTTT
jgi:hypothetical protein